MKTLAIDVQLSQIASSRPELSWLACDELRGAVNELATQPGFKQSPSERDAEPVSFIDNEEFSVPGAGDEIFAEALDLQREDNSVKGSGLPPHLNSLCAASLLTPTQERMLFQRMNFLLWAAATLRAENPLELSESDSPNLSRLVTSLAMWHRDRIVEANLRLVFSIVKSFVNPHVTFDDLLADGMLAIIRAAEKFDFAKGFRFSTYATQVVRRNSYRLVVDKQTDRSRVMNGFEELELDQEEASVESSMTEQRWHQLRSQLAKFLDNLEKREKLIIRARFSLGSHRKAHTLQSIADRLGVSKERVRQIEKRAIEKLQRMAGVSANQGFA